VNYPFLTLKERDLETGLDFFINRYYSPTQGRFTGPDEPFADQQPGDPQSWNLYSYTRNNPLRYTDPDGRGIFDFISENLQKGFNAVLFGYRVTNAELAVIVERQREFLISKTAPDGFLYVRMGEEGAVHRLDPRTMRGFEVLDMYDRFNDPRSREFPLTQEIIDNAITVAGAAPALKGDPYHPDSVSQRQNGELTRLRERMQSVGREAERLGFDRRIPVQKAPFNSHGQEVFSNGKHFITRDVDSHAGGVWKMFDRAGRRIGTYDANLNRIGP
jgi:RHS repeat-associated protein